MRFQHCKSSKKTFVFFVQIKDRLVGTILATELMGHVAIPYDWKEFVFHRGCALDINSIIETGIVAGGRKQGGKTNHLPHTSQLFWLRSR